eukprot:m51a1_g6282 hypothetical protein (313) ;mRNA; r:218831-229333
MALPRLVRPLLLVVCFAAAQLAALYYLAPLTYRVPPANDVPRVPRALCHRDRTFLVDVTCEPRRGAAGPPQPRRAQPLPATSPYCAGAAEVEGLEGLRVCTSGRAPLAGEEVAAAVWARRVLAERAAGGGGGGGAVVDVGAGHGLRTLVAARMGFSVVAFESDPVLADLLWRSVHLMGVANRVTLFVNAVDDVELCWHNIVNHLKSLDKSHLTNLFSCSFFCFWSMQGILWLTLDKSMIGFLGNLPFIQQDIEPEKANEQLMEQDKKTEQQDSDTKQQDDAEAEQQDKQQDEQEENVGDKQQDQEGDEDDSD